MTKVKFATRDGRFAASIVTRRVDAAAALIGNFKGEGFRVISLHRRAELAKPEDVRNSSYTEVHVAYPI